MRRANVDKHAMDRAARVVGVLVSALALVTAMAAPAHADAGEDGGGDGGVGGGKVVEVTRTAPAMHPGETAWVAVVWAARQTVDDFAVVATATGGATVAYPGGRASTSLYGSSTLVKRTEDFTALQVSVPYGAVGPVRLRLHATWNDEHGHGGSDEDAELEVPLTPYHGPDLTWTTTSVQVPRATPTWVSFGLTAGAPRLDHVQVTVSGPGDLAVGYPNDGASSGLNDGSSLQGGASDHAAARLDASALEPGTYDLTVTVAYDAPDHRTNEQRVSLVVS